jgi:hypothetical protein
MLSAVLKGMSELDRRVESRKILNLLARGIHPLDGSVLDAESCLSHPVVIRALLFAADYLEGDIFVTNPSAKKTLSISRAGKAWPPEEDNELHIGFNQGNTLQVLAECHHRSEGAILARLVHLCLANDRDEVRKIFAQRRIKSKAAKNN